MVSSALSIKEGLALLKSIFNLQVVILGTRADDPDGRWQRSPVEPTSSGWPELIRVCPVFQWSYHDIWGIIRDRQLPFCPLYKEGYTSIGGMSITSKNENLAIRMDRNGEMVVVGYRPAWALSDGSKERDGRRPKEPWGSPATTSSATSCAASPNGEVPPSFSEAPLLESKGHL